MKIEILAISDTHLGEDCSLLSFPQGRQRLWEVLHKILGGGRKFTVKEVILLGDIPDRTLSSTSQIIADTNAFMETVGSVANVKKGVYIPGNHDHTIWTKYRKGRYGDKTGHMITTPEGELIVEEGIPTNDSDEVKNLLSLFFGYPCGSSWRAIAKEKAFDFAIANPLYARTINERTYVFTHGTHFRWDVTLPAWQKKIADYLQVDRILGGIEIDSGEDIKGDEEMDELERKVTRFVDSLWQSSRNNPITQSDELWYIITSLGGKFEGQREAPIGSKLFKRGELPSATKEHRINKITGTKDNSLKLFDRYFRRPMVKHLEKNDLPTNKITLVYGDTHKGGWEDTFKVEGISDFMIYNTGGWVVDNKDLHPPCHIFGILSSGEEFMFDVSFKDVKVEGEEIIDLASEQVEHRKGVVSKTLSAVWNRFIDHGRRDV